MGLLLPILVHTTDPAIAPPLAPRPNRLGLGPERGGFLAAIERLEGVYNRRRRYSGSGVLTPAWAYEQIARAA